MGMVHPMMNGERKKGKPYLEIKLSELDQGDIRIDCDIPIEWLQERMTFCEYSVIPRSANAMLTAQTTGNGVFIHGWIRSVFETQCGTCLKTLLLNIAPEISTYLVPKAEAAKEFGDTELTPEDLDREYYEGDTIVLDEIIGDAIMLEMPMNPKCEGACEVFRTSHESRDVPDIDPRLAPLMGIQIKKEN